MSDHEPTLDRAEVIKRMHAYCDAEDAIATSIAHMSHMRTVCDDARRSLAEVFTTGSHAVALGLDRVAIVNVSNGTITSVAKMPLINEPETDHD